MRVDYDLPCYDPAHLAMIFMVVVPMIVVYIIGLPLMTFVAISKQSKRAKRSDKVRFRYGLFTDGYKRNRLWWETVVAVRKAILIGISVFLSTYGVMVQAYLGILVIGIFLLVHMAEKPYRKGLLNSLESKGMGTCLITLYAGLLFFNRYLTSDTVIVVAEIIVMTINLGFVATCVLQLALEYALSVS